MDHNVESLVDDVQKLAPSMKRCEIVYLVSEMSRRSGIRPVTLLTVLYEDLRSGIPFRYTAVGKSRTTVHWQY